ncbi:MAG TPA: AAA family ATPase [Rhodopila sp.]|jgi:PAS domain S-box-containing protein|nr:AAA family ATPase [Rhodopila sp.]
MRVPPSQPKDGRQSDDKRREGLPPHDLASRGNSIQILWEDDERVFCRGRCQGGSTVLIVRPATEHPSPPSLDRLAHEFGLKDELDGAWAVRPLELEGEGARTRLVLEDPGGEPLDRLLGAPMEVENFLRLAIGIAAVLGNLHRRGLVHKDIKPAHILVNGADGQVRLTGFGIASRLSRERQMPEPPDTVAGTLAYMAPEQTGRMNRSIDSRSDLYALGVTFYQMLTGALPFTASDPMEWVHCHIARQPLAPSMRLETVPAPVSHLVLKLLAKTAEERYQTAAGVARDLQHCLTDWERRGRIDDFPLGQHDMPDRLRIPEKLYGRTHEVETLLAAFDRVATRGVPELVMVSGYSGIGKSSVVNEVHKVLVPPRGLFASGKFDQYKRDIPYSTLVQAFQSLVRPLLGKSDTELASWRGALLEALEPNARLMTDLIPELKLIIGEPPPVPELEPQQAQGRFQLLFLRFIGVFARPEHPLALFLDDLQWLDAATLDLLEVLLTSGLQHLMLIGAYRDNEVDATHPLRRQLDNIRNTGARIEEITLAPLAREHIATLIADTLHSGAERAAPLAQLVHAKTSGNPFFVIQFLQALAEEGLLTFDYDAACWSWDLDRIHDEGHTDNVVDLMVGKLTRLPIETQQALSLLACLGNVASIPMLSIVFVASEEEVHTALWPALRQELVERLHGSYKFIHDRVQEAAYSLIREALRAEAHLRIGRLLVAQTPPAQQEEAIFDIVNQMNRGAALITEREERDQLAELNLIAGKRAKGATAYATALTYLSAGAECLSNDRWERRHELIFGLELNQAECEFLTGAPASAEERLNKLSTRAATTIERASVACLLLDLYTTRGQSSRGLAVGLDYLRHLGGEWSPHPSDEDVRREYERFWSQLGSRTIEDLIDLPSMTDPASLATMDVLTKIVPPTFLREENLYALAMCWAVNLSLEQGNSDGSCAHYVWFGCIAGGRFRNYKSAHRFGRLGCELVEQRGLKRFQARTYLVAGTHLTPYTKHVRTARNLLRHGFEIANKSGDLMFMGWYCCFYLLENLLAAGDPLIEVQREAERGLAFAQKMQLGHVVDLIPLYIGLARMLRGLTPKFGSFNDERFDEAWIESRLANNLDFALVECLYQVRKLQARFHAGDYTAAIRAAARAERAHPGILRLMFTAAEYHFYDALARAAWCDCAPVEERPQHMDAVAAHHRQLQAWAENCPENFENRVALVGAEMARLEDRDGDAIRLYEQAIRSAKANGFVHNEAIAYERASGFYRARGCDQIADLYLRNSRYAYVRWGADGKVRQLDELYPQLRPEEPPPEPSRLISTPVEQLDLATVIKVSQALSGEIVPERLIYTLMRTAIEQAGAERGLLILADGGEQRMAAEATTSGETVVVRLRDDPIIATAVPESVLHYVLRVRESVILDDAAAQSRFAADPYIQARRTRSVLCLPLLNQSKLVGVLYLENNLAPRVFAPGRITVLKLLASQAAITLENSRLYRDLAEREAKIRRLVDANIIGIFIWDFDGRILEANDAFLRIVGYDREDFMVDRLRWTDLTPPEWLDRDTQQWVPEIRTTGTLQPYEKEYFRKDGSRVPVLIGAVIFEDGGHEGVAFVLDLTERKRAEAEVRESEGRYRAVQTELAHANRVATMGQLTASIAHEVNQPIAATVINAQAGLRWLAMQPPDLEEVRQTLVWIVESGTRAGDVIGRIRALIKKAPPRKHQLDLNEAIREVVELTHREAMKNDVLVQMKLTEDLPIIAGDRVELQQVILNLIINAIEAMSGVMAGPRDLLISTGTAEPDGVRVAVQDTGPGLPPSSVERLFEAFFTTKASGMGMGLSICRSIIEAHGGRLWASANLPHGAIFQFTLPTVPDTSAFRNLLQ